MTVSRDDIVQVARAWLGTPFHHQGRAKGAGVDCAGLIVGVAGQLALSSFDTDGYGHRPDSREMEEICRAQMVPISLEEARPGDVYLIEIDQQPQHLAFKTDIGLLHSYAPARGVVEHLINEEWADRLLEAFSLPGVE